MTTTRCHRLHLDVSVPAERLFSILHTPSAICAWWGAHRAIVVPQEGGMWCAAWGDDGDSPEYVTIAKICIFDAPSRMKFSDFYYHACKGQMPFDSSALTTEFLVTSRDGGSRLTVVQDGFPSDSAADEFYAACEIGWQQTFKGIEAFLAKPA